ncbi:MAG: hypothetical protein ABEJ82_06385 [Haloplanus sp.]
MSESQPDTEPDRSTDADSDDSTRTRVRRYANYAVLAVLGLLAFVAVVQLYLSTSRVITTWITSEYRSLFQAAFNLLVLLLAGVGISYQLKRMR